MRIPRVLLGAAAPGATLVAGPESFLHLVTVLRRGVGDRVEVVDGAGGVFEGRIAAIDHGPQRVSIEVGVPLPDCAPPIAPLCAAVGVPKGEALDLAVRLASETGLTELVPLLTARTIARPRADSGKLRRWRRIAEEAAAQCRRPIALEVTDPVEFPALLETLPPERAWIAVPGGPPPRDAGLLDALASPPPAEPATARSEAASSLVVAIGPEGGFTATEIERAVEAGMRPLGFPAPVLRTPTAVVYLGALAALVDAQR